MQEREAVAVNGLLMILVDLALLGGGIWLLVAKAADLQVWHVVLGVLLIVVGVLVATGFLVNDPNISKVVLFFGRYLGTISRNGCGGPGR